MEEVENLLAVGFIREVYYPEWLANVVMVKKVQCKVENECGLHKLKSCMP